MDSSSGGESIRAWIIEMTYPYFLSIWSCFKKSYYKGVSEIIIGNILWDKIKF